MLRQGFLCWMSKPGGTCCDIKAHVAVLKTNRRQNHYRDIKYHVATLIIATWKILLRHCMKKLCCDNVMNVATLEDKVSSPDRETKSRQVMFN